MPGTAASTSFNEALVGYQLANGRVQGALDELKRSATTFVFSPGGTRSGMVWTSWADVMTAKDQCPGPKRILLDDTNTSPPEFTPLCRIPPGTYDFRDCSFEGMPRGNQTRVDIGADPFDPGDVVFMNLEQIGPNLFCYVNNLVTPWITLPSDKSCGIVKSSVAGGAVATVPAIYVPPLLPATDPPIFFLDGGEIQSGFGAANTMTVDEALYLAAGNLGSEIEDDSIEGAGTVTLVLFLPAGFALFSPWPPSQPGLAGLNVLKANLISADLNAANWGGPGVPESVEEMGDRIAAAVAGLLGGPIP